MDFYNQELVRHMQHLQQQPLPAVSGAGPGSSSSSSSSGGGGSSGGVRTAGATTDPLWPAGEPG